MSAHSQAVEITFRPQFQDGLLEHAGTMARARENAPVPGRILRRDDHLFRAGDRLTSTYRVVSGMLKSYSVGHDGDEHVLGFHMPGDIVGYEALVGTRATRNVVALDTTNVRPVPVHGRRDGDSQSETDAVSATVACLHGEIQRLVYLLRLERAPAASALASFLLAHGSAQQRRGCRRCEFVLPMSRRDLGNYLGLAPETLSRVLGRFRRNGLITLDGNLVTILDEDGLRAEAGDPTSRQCSARGQHQ